MKKVIRYPLQAIDAGDNRTNVADGEGLYLIYQNTELSLNQWKFIVEQLNEVAKQGKYIPEESK